MADSSPFWDAYASRQQQLAERTTVDDLAWGLEAILNKLLDQPDIVPADDELERVSASEGRGVRYRRALLIQYTPCLAATIDPWTRLAARSDLTTLRRKLSPRQMELLIEYGDRDSSAELAANNDVNKTALRARVKRGRRTARSLLVPAG